MFVRLSGPDFGPGAARRWTDAASAEHGDLLDVIRESSGLVEFREVAEEARRFLSLPRAEPRAAPRPPAPQGSPEAARRLWAMAKPLAGTLAEAYLHARGIKDLRGCRPSASILGAGIAATMTTLAIRLGMPGPRWSRRSRRSMAR